MKNWFRLAVIAILAALFAYVTTYLVLTRQASARADAYDLEGYYFVFPPEDTEHWRRSEQRYRLAFLPLIAVENAIGTGETPASPPLWRLH